jgi:hypothetical protein
MAKADSIRSLAKTTWRATSISVKQACRNAGLFAAGLAAFVEVVPPFAFNNSGDGVSTATFG